MQLVSLVGLLGTAGASYTYDLTIDLCDSSGCHPTQKRVALDVDSYATEKQVHSSGDELVLEYSQDAGGPRVYLIEEDGVNENHMFTLAGKEFTFDVELSSMTCGFNAAMYFVGMDKNEGGAEDGSKYCDAQAVSGVYCSEMDLWEANTVANQVTTHGCIDECATYSDAEACKKTSGDNDICDHDGCGINPFRHGPGSTYDAEMNTDGFYGFGSENAVDTSQPFTVTTQFKTDHIARFYTQNGVRIELPPQYVGTPTDGSHYEAFESPKISDDFCALIYDRWTASGLGPATQFLKNSKGGQVLAISAWYDQETYQNGHPSGSQTGMSWLDGTNNWGGSWTKTGPCDTTTSDEGKHQATFSKIRFGDLGTTTVTPAPAPAPAPTPPPTPPPTPTPTPTPPEPSPPAPAEATCCWGECGSTSCSADGYCGENEDQCTGNCGGMWCSKASVFV